MTEIKLYNTATRRKEVFEPLEADNIRLYLCGPTVYDRAHLGNARPVIVFDVLQRLLRHVYGQNSVTYVRNFTDVDDKINATALARQQAGAMGTLQELVRERSDETIRWYLDDMAALGTREPDHMPRATEYIPQMVTMIEGLIAGGFAYAAEGHVLFAVDSYEAYGKLSGRSVDDMIAGARVEVAPYKRNPMDFVLWKPSDDATPGWPSPWGRGRPGWHIECSAMSKALLGPKFDIHGGGNDLMFPHHENEIAQSCCADPGAGFASVWLHNEMLQVEGKKMSKSLGNFFTVRDLLDQGVPGEVIRFVFLSTHYRKPMDWTEKKRAEAEKAIEGLVAALKVAIEHGQPPSGTFSELPKGMQEALVDDLNTHLARVTLEAVGKLVLGLSKGDIAGDLSEASSQFLAGLEVMGFYQSFLARLADKSSYKSTLEDLKLKFANQRELAMQTKDFGELDAMKSALLAAGVEVRMSKTGVDLAPGPDFDPTKLEGLL